MSKGGMSPLPIAPIRNAIRLRIRMARSTPEWIEENHDKPIPERIRRLVVRRADGICDNCRVRVRVGSGHIDHIIALCNGGEHRTSNLQFLCKNCHSAKTAKDVARKAADNKTHAAIHGYSKSKGRAFNRPKKPKPKQGRWVEWIDENGRSRATWVRGDEEQ
jgi:5-methylcytosine-specific restriction protein A